MLIKPKQKEDPDANINELYQDTDQTHRDLKPSMKPKYDSSDEADISDDSEVEFINIPRPGPGLTKQTTNRFNEQIKNNIQEILKKKI